MPDIIVIGAGVTGCAIARELSRYQREVFVLEQASDVCEGTSKANSGIVHAGFDALPSTLKAKLNVQGNNQMEQLSKDLDFPFKKNGSMVLCFDPKREESLQILLERGKQNGVKDLQILTREEAVKLEPGISSKVTKVLWAPSGGIVCPFGLTIALAENAYMNGVIFKLNTRVENIHKDDSGKYVVITNNGVYKAAIVINAAGVHADIIHGMVSKVPFSIQARKGEYCLFDKEAGSMVTKTLFQLPSDLGKGILVTPTVHGNLMTGPTAENEDDKEAVNTTYEGMSQVLSRASDSVENIPAKMVITSFAGLRAHGDHRNAQGDEDFLIEEAEDAKGFIDVAGIESPGLSCAPAIGVYVANIVNDIQSAPLKENFISKREGIPCMAEAAEEEKKALINKNPAYANVICRCEQVTEGEILEAIHRPLGATTVDGVKRRTRAGMGRCQSGFCLPKTMEILAHELGVDEEEIKKSGENANYLVGKNKELGEEQVR